MINSRILLLFAATLIIALPSFAMPITPHKADRVTVEKFLIKLEKAFPLPKGEEQFISDFDGGKTTITTKTNDGSWSNIHSLWIADINNDGISEYVWTWEEEGTGRYDYFDIYREEPKGTLIKVDFPSTNLYENDSDGQIQKIPLLYENGSTYLILENMWSEDKNGKILHTGALCNTAPDAYYFVEVKYKYLWNKTGIHLISKKKSKNKFSD